MAINTEYIGSIQAGSSAPVPMIAQRLEAIEANLGSIDVHLDQLCGGAPADAKTAAGPRPVPSGFLDGVSERLAAIVQGTERTRMRLAQVLG